MEGSAQNLIGLIYDSCIAPDVWHVFAEELRQSTDSRSVLLAIQDFHTLDVSTDVRVGWDPRDRELYNRDFYNRDLWVRALIKKQPNKFYSAEQLAPERVMRKSDIYNDFCSKVDVGYAGGAYFQIDHSDTIWRVSLQKTNAQGDLSTENLKLLDFIQPHLYRAHKVARMFTGLNVGLSALSMVSNDSYFLVDNNAKVVSSSDDAFELATQRDEWTIRQGKLSSKHHQAKLDGGIQSIFTGKNISQSAFRYANNSGSFTSVSFLPVKVPMENFHGNFKTLVCVLLSKDDAPIHQLDELRLASIYSLTTSESKITSALCAGKSSLEIREQMCITQNTLKSHLKSIFSKTDVNSQTQLVAKLMQNSAVRKH